MNPIHQSLSSLLSNPALQADGSATRKAPARGGERVARVDGKPSAAATDGLATSTSASARQALAAQNEAARMNVVRDPAEARELTQLVGSALRGGFGELSGAHRNLDSRNVASLLR